MALHVLGGWNLLILEVPSSQACFVNTPGSERCWNSAGQCISRGTIFVGSITVQSQCRPDGCRRIIQKGSTAELCPCHQRLSTGWCSKSPSLVSTVPPHARGVTLTVQLLQSTHSVLALSANP